MDGSNSRELTRISTHTGQTATNVPLLGTSSAERNPATQHCLFQAVAHRELLPPGYLSHRTASPMLDKLRLLLFALCVLAGGELSSRADNWPQWRGPEGDGTSRDTDLPIVWNKAMGVKWRCPLPEWSNSTPAIWENSIFVTTQVDNKKLLLLKIDKTEGRIEWTRQVGEGVCPHQPLQEKSDDKRRHQFFEKSHNYASPSPVTDGRRVVVHFGNGDLAAYDLTAINFGIAICRRTTATTRSGGATPTARCCAAIW